MNDFQTPYWAQGLPDGFYLKFLGMQAWQWLALALLLVIAYIFKGVGKLIAIRLMKWRDHFSATKLSEATKAAIRRSSGILAATLIVYPLLPELVLPKTPEHHIRVAMEAITIAALVLLAYGLWDAVCDTIAERSANVSSRAERLLVPMTRKFVRFLILVGGLLIGLGVVFEVNVAGLIAGLGIGGLVVALAAKDSVENIFGSLTILFDMPFAIGDWVKIDKVEGIVEEINLRSTRIRTFEDSVITLPNANLIRASVENVSSRRWRRQKFYLRLSYDNKPEQVQQLCDGLLKYIEAQESIQPGRSIVGLSEMDEPSMGLLIQCYFDASSQTDEVQIKHDLMKEALRLRDHIHFEFSAAPRPLDPILPSKKTLD